MPPAEQRKHFSHSQLAMLSKCGLQWFYRYVEGRVIPPGIAMIRGTATHGSVQADLQSKIDKGELLEDEVIADLAAQIFDQRVELEGVDYNSDDRAIGTKAALGAGKDRAVRLSKHHHATDAPTIDPVTVERPFRLTIEGFERDLVGYIDVEARTPEGGIIIEDTKTSAKTPSKGAADLSNQLTVYSLAAWRLNGERPVGVRLRTLVDLKRGPTTNIQESTRDDLDFERILLRMDYAQDQVRSGAFMPARPDDWWCSEKWCGYHAICPFGARQKRQVSVPDMSALEECPDGD